MPQFSPAESAQMRRAWLAADHPRHGWEHVISEDSTLATVQKCIRSWQRSGADECAVPLLLSDIGEILKRGFAVPK